MSTVAPPAIPGLPAGTVPVPARPRVTFSSVNRTVVFSTHDPPSAITLATLPPRDASALPELCLRRASSCEFACLSLPARDAEGLASPLPRGLSPAVAMPLSLASGRGPPYIIDCDGEEGGRDEGDGDDEESGGEDEKWKGGGGGGEEEGKDGATGTSYDEQWRRRSKSLVVDELGRTSCPLLPPRAPAKVVSNNGSSQKLCRWTVAVLEMESWFRFLPLRLHPQHHFRRYQQQK